MTRRPIVVAVALVYAVGLALLLLLPVGWILNRLSVRLYVLWTYDLDLSGGMLPEDFGVLLNVVLFVPLGVLLALITGWAWWRVTLLGIVASSLVELLQLLPTVHREASVSDVLANAIGALLGALIVAVRRRA